MKRFILIFLSPIFIFVFLLFSDVMAGGRVIIKHYDKDYNRTGYTTIENGRETHYDKDWNRTGYSVSEKNKTRHYDIQRERTGETILNGDTGFEFDQNGNRTGYSIYKDGNRIQHYDRDWNRQGQSEINDYEKKEDFRR